MREKEIKIVYNNVLGQTFSETRRFLFVGNRFGDIFVQDLKELDKNSEDAPGRVKRYYQGEDIEVNCLCFHRGFLIVGAIGVIYGLKWDEENQLLSSEHAWEIKIPLDVDAVEVPDINSMWLRPESDTLFAACGDGVLYQISLEDGRIVRDYRGHTDYLHGVTGTENGRICTASEDGSVRFWCEREKLHTALIEPYTKPELLRPDWGKWIGAVAANDNWLICGGGPKLSMWHLGSMEFTSDLPFPGRVHVCDFIDDSIVVAGEHNHAQLYSLTGSLEANIPIELTACYSVVWQKEPSKLMSISGFGNKLHILKDFRYLDCKIDLYGNVDEEEVVTLNSEDEDVNEDSDD